MIITFSVDATEEDRFRAIARLATFIYDKADRESETEQYAFDIIRLAEGRYECDVMMPEETEDA